MVDIVTRSTSIPGRVTRTRKVARASNATVTTGDQEAVPVQAGERRAGRRERRKVQRKVLLDLRSGRDRRRASKGQGIDVEI